MWERENKQNPMSIRYMYNLDNRPILPQDPTLDNFTPRHDYLKLKYYKILSPSGKKYICSNNLPAKDVQAIDTYVNMRDHFFKTFRKVAIVPTIILSVGIFREIKMPYKIIYPIGIYLIYKFNYLLLKMAFLTHHSGYLTYYYQKYIHMLVDDIKEVDDIRRKHFRIDTDVYYRESAEDIAGHHGHDDESDHGEHHDTSTYYGPLPV